MPRAGAVLGHGAIIEHAVCGCQMAWARCFVAPKTPKAFPNLTRARPKTSVQGGGGLRKRWKDDDGNIWEWDSQHGELEKYSPKGKHLGAFDPEGLFFPREAQDALGRAIKWRRPGRDGRDTCNPKLL